MEAVFAAKPSRPRRGASACGSSRRALRRTPGAARRGRVASRGPRRIRAGSSTQRPRAVDCQALIGGPANPVKDRAISPGRADRRGRHGRRLPRASGPTASSRSRSRSSSSPRRCHDRRRAARFRAERQILATLHHPDIVALLDGGVTAAGQPYLVMEYVDGVPITDYCARARLPLDDRLRLFQRVCAAVQLRAPARRRAPRSQARQHPGHAGRRPKVLDFGIAKLLDDPVDAGGATHRTALRGPLTPNYASPEQLRGLPVTTACDVYALGVLLYELLTGVTAVRRLEPAARRGAGDRGAKASRAGRAPRTSPALLPYDARQLRGDLDAIVLKAMHKEPSHRYASAQELSDDIARPPRLAARSSRASLRSRTVAAQLARRHRAAFVAGSVSIAALLAALGVSLWQTRVAMAERDRATARFNDTRQLANALIFKIHDEVWPLAGFDPGAQVDRGGGADVSRATQ